MKWLRKLFTRERESVPCILSAGPSDEDLIAWEKRLGQKWVRYAMNVVAQNGWTPGSCVPPWVWAHAFYQAEQLKAECESREGGR